MAGPKRRSQPALHRPSRAIAPVIDVGQVKSYAKSKQVIDRKPSEKLPVPKRRTHEGIEFADLLTPLDPKLSASSRLDPYWDGVWATGSSDASWVSPDLAARQSAAGLGRLPVDLDLSPEEALDYLSQSIGWQQRLAILGAVDMWRTLSGEQLASLVGDSTLASFSTKSISSLFGAGIIDLGVFRSLMLDPRLSEQAILVRPGYGDVFVDQIEPHLTYPEWVSITGGTAWGAGGQYDRHNLLATELGLRIAEFCDIGTVIGEKHTTVDQLAGTGLGLEVDNPDRRRADLAIVRPDGLRIAIEVTASSGKNFADKVRRWITLLAERPLAESGLTLLFVVAAAPEREMSHDYRSRSDVYRTIAKLVRENPGSKGNPVAERIAAVTWRDWFPARGEASPDFLTMRAHRPTGPGASWEEADLLDPRAFNFSTVPGHPLRAVVTQSSLLTGTPHWLRDTRDCPQVWPVLLERSGHDGIPVPAPAKPDRAPSPGLGVAHGPIEQAKPPRRLRIEAHRKAV